jgi:hypothetical protein
LTMKLFFNILLILVSLSNLSCISGSWINFEYEEARIYLYGLKPDSTYESEPSIIVNGQLSKTVVNPEGIKLTKNQIDKVNHILSPHFHFGSRKAASCFIPHHGIVFFKSGIPVAHVSACVMCNQVKAYPKDGFFDREEFIELLEEVHLPVFRHPGDIDEYLKKN